MKVVFLPPKSRSKQVKHHFRDVSLVKLRNLCSGPMQVSLRLSGLKMSQGWEQPQDSGFKRLFLQTLTEEYSNSMMSMYYYIQRCSYNLWMARLIAPHYEGIVDTQLYRFFGSWDEGIHYYKRLHANIYIYIRLPDSLLGLLSGYSFSPKLPFNPGSCPENLLAGRKPRKSGNRLNRSRT